MPRYSRDTVSFMMATMMLVLLLFCTYLSLATAYSAPPLEFCKVSIAYSEFGTLQPLILTEDGSQFLYPEETSGGNLKIASGKSIYLACPGEKNYIKDTNNIQEQKATCVKDKTFSVSNKPRQFSSLTCMNRVRATTTMPKSGQDIQIGFQLNGKFLETIKLSHDKATHVTHYSMFKLTKKHGNIQTGYPRPSSWRDANYFDGLGMESLYNWEEQVNIIGKILKSPDRAKNLITAQQFLSRGHLTAKSDFVYGSQQDATFSYLNAAPQWYTFNSGNWAELEKGVQKLVRDRSIDLDVYTGVHEQLTMEDVDGQQQKISLAKSDTKAPLIVPKYFWKVIYDPQKKLGTAFVGLNDPFKCCIDDTDYLCEDRIESKINWLNWTPTDIEKGFSYACPVESLRKKIPTIPKLDVVGALI